MRIALVAGPDPGHLFPAAGLALRLQAAGHDPLVVTGTRWADALAAAGLQFAELPLLATTPWDGDFGWRLYGRAAQMAPPLADLLRAEGAGLVVSDVLTVCGGFAAGLVGVPWVELVPHPLPDPSLGLPPPGSGIAPARGPVGRTRDAGLRRLAEPSRRLAVQQRADARRSLGLPAVGSPAARLVAALPALEVPRPDWPAGAHLVGPLDWDPARVHLDPPPGRRPLVLVSGSTASGGVLGLLDVAVAGLAGLGFRLVATRLEADGAAEPRPDATRLEATRLEATRLEATRLEATRQEATRQEAEGPAGPDWVRVGVGRQLPLVAQADVVVCGAGHGILAKALGAGVPVVCVPGGGDQRENAARLRRLGAGVVLPPRRLTPEWLAAAVLRVLGSPGYRARARAAGDTSRVPPADAVTVVQTVLPRA